MKFQLSELQKCKNLSELQAYQPLVQFYKHYYKRELAVIQLTRENSATGRILPKIRTTYDLVATFKEKNMVDLLRAYFITPHEFIDNLTNQVCEHVPQPTYVQFEERIHSMEDTVKRDEFLQSIIKFAAIELSVQPYIRRHVKQYLL